MKSNTERVAELRALLAHRPDLAGIGLTSIMTELWSS